MTTLLVIVAWCLFAGWFRDWGIEAGVQQAEASGNKTERF
jgi:hypothetical protein